MMKGTVMLLAASLALVGCGGEPELTAAQEFELKKLQMVQNHERDLARISANTQREVGYQPVEAQQYGQGNWDERTQTPATAQYNDVGTSPDMSQSSDSGSSMLGTVAALGAGALAGYAMSELLDDGHRSYRDSSGRTRYVDGSGKEISSAQYDAYKKKHPTKHKISEYNQKGKAVVNTGAEKTAQAATTVKTKTVETAKKVDQKVVQPAKKTVQKKVSSYKSSSSKRR